MQISLQNVGKEFEYRWILNNINFTFQPGMLCSITGPNGSGKTTLLKLLSAYLTPSKGKINFALDHNPLPPEEIYQYLSLAAPFSQLPEELTFPELLKFQEKFKPFYPGLTHKDLTDLHGYHKSFNQPISQFSSGMLQRVNLILSFCSNTPLLLLDEPTSFLDNDGKQWFENLLKRFHFNNRLIIIATNSTFEASLCSDNLSLASRE